ncbi:polysaccharide export protein [Luteimonas sp. 8-5]|uniref:polysaccharide biosynthesis/export family protein n=1 Tax=Luteimonas sp. 8-5 TaxID=3039387 RepID=UPI0024368008|nr:polysaccharide export protein [Luteimonas sp. 8-5]MDG6348275.1 polysaccharide export protein [Luteimonas sp. 8-5]
MLACWLLAACGSSPVRNPNLLQNEVMRAPDTTSASGIYTGGSDYRIGAQDLLEIRVFGIQQLDKEVRVNSNGQISLPLIGGVMAGGKTIPELQKTLEDKLKDGYLQDPQVSVFVKEYTSQRITLEGALTKPGIYPITGRTTLLQAIALAEGVTDLADLQGVVIFRKVKGKRMGAVFDLAQIRAGAVEDPRVYGDDIVIVEKSGSKSAYRTFIESVPVFNIFRWY